MTPIASFAASTPAVRRTSNLNRWAMQAMVVLLGSSLLWASAKAQIPFWPIPVTLQTYVVLTLGALFGWRLGAATVAAYLAEGALGLPVFAGTPADGIGLAYMIGPTGGYLVGYIVAVILVARLTERGRDRFVLSIAAALLAGEMAILGFGCAWLAILFGWKEALILGFGPFIFGDGLKLVLAGATISYGRRLRAHFDR